VLHIKLKFKFTSLNSAGFWWGRRRSNDCWIQTQDGTSCARRM